MPIYHRHRSQAETLRDELLIDPRLLHVRVEFEPYMGWVVVVTPKPQDVTDLLPQAEVRDGVHRQYPRNRPAPVSPASPAKGKAAPTQPGQANPPATRAPRGAGKAHPCWPAIAAMHAQGAGRAATLAALKQQGVDARTATRQYRHWLKANGHWPEK